MTRGKFSNSELADVFQKISDLLEVKGEVIYKILAYRKAADSLSNLAGDVSELPFRNAYWRQDRLSDIPGVGKAIAEKIDELLSTGKLEFLERLEREVPPSIIDVLQVPDLGPKKAALFWKQLGVTDLASLEAAARDGKLRELPGMGEKSEAKVLAGIEAVRRRSGRILLGQAWPFVQELLAYLSMVPGVSRNYHSAASAAGSLRRRNYHSAMRTTVGDLDILAAAVDSGPLMHAFTNHPAVIAVSGQGETKRNGNSEASVEFEHGLRAQLWVHPAERWGTALQYATGSKDHNVRLREMALKSELPFRNGLSLSDQAFTRPDGSEILCASEEDVYAQVGLPWIAPELREDRGEIQAAKTGKLPRLIERSDLIAELHSHSTWSDGRNTIQEMAEEARARGYKVLEISELPFRTDHSASLGVAGGLSADELKAQRVEIDAVQHAFGDSLLILQGAEVEIRADGSLDFPDEVLAELDIVIASLHSGLRQSREQVTMRTINSELPFRAIRNPHVDLIGHPTERMLPNREGADLDMEAVFAAASESGVALEINAHPARLDLDDIYARRAIERRDNSAEGIPLSINTDAHNPADMDLVHFGVSTARRGWVEAQNVINCWQTEKLISWLRQRK